MHTSAPQSPPQGLTPALVARRPWPDAFTQASLQVFADGLIRFAGFGTAVISVAREDGNMHVAAVAGATRHDEAQIRTLKTPVALVKTLLRDSEDWGRFRFYPGENAPVGPEWGWVPQIEVLDAPDAWHPDDVLIAPLYDASDALIGTVSVDVPLDGRRPSQPTRDLLNRYAEQSGRAIVAAIQRREHAEQAELAHAARMVVNEATINSPITDDFAALSSRLTELLGLSHVRIRVLSHAGPVVRDIGMDVPPANCSVREAVDDVYNQLWGDQQVMVVGRNQLAGSPSATFVEETMAFLDELGAGSLLVAPIGTRYEGLGTLTLVRPNDSSLWTEGERHAVLEICRDLGRVIVNERLADEQKMITRELRDIETHRSRLIRTVAHELKTPLTVLSGNLELFANQGVRPDEVTSTLSRMTAATDRMQRLVEDLAAVTRSATRPQASAPNDLSAMVRDTCTLLPPLEHALTLQVDLPPHPVVVHGEPASLDRVIVNLISNAVKYTDVGGHVSVTVSDEGEWACFEVADSGIGISEADQDRLFRDFFRGANAQEHSGTGLGLTIAARIITRLGGTISVESTLGEGSVFTVRLPLARPTSEQNGEHRED